MSGCRSSSATLWGLQTFPGRGAVSQGLLVWLVALSTMSAQLEGQRLLWVQSIPKRHSWKPPTPKESHPLSWSWVILV